MAIQRGGLFGRASGNVGGVVFGAARTRTGKVVTARELVFPSNPKTAGQVLQRSIFKEALFAVRHLTASLYQNDWNRSIGQLPGFQSMMSIILDNTDAAEHFVAPPVTPLGNLHQPDTQAFNSGAGIAGTMDLAYSTELGLNGTAADILVVFFCQHAAEVDFSRPAALLVSGFVRSDGGGELTLPKNNEEYTMCMYFQGAGAAAGLLSPAFWEEATSHS